MNKIIINLAIGATALLYTIGSFELGAYVQKLDDESRIIKPKEPKLHEGWVCAPYSK